MKKKVIEKNILENLYLKEKLTTYQIAKKLNCSQGTVWKNLVAFRIKRRSPYELNSRVPTKEELMKLYVKNKLSTWEIEKRFKYSRGTIHRKLKEHNIPIRNRSDSHIIHKKTSFSADLIEKAYLVGFRIGDLGVRKMYPGSKTICIATGSTQIEQINLVRSMFEAYGKLWIKKTKDKINMQTFLNNSFEFLLSKEFPTWIERDKSLFFSFLAGFTDAEGSIKISNNAAYYSLGNYDSKTLVLIYENLNKLGIKCKEPWHDNRKGKENSQGYKYSSNYWSLRISKKENLLKLLLELKPFIKHENKIKDLNRAIENINYRNGKKQILHQHSN